MKTIKNLGFALALALGATAAGCAADSPTGDGTDDGSGSDTTTRPLDATGKYQMASRFDIATNAPGKVGEVTNMFISMTDGADDPADYLLELAISKLGSGPVKTAANGLRPFIAGYLNDRLLDWAPNFVTTIVQVGNDFGQMARNFGLNETIDIAAGGAQYNATVTALGVHFKVDNIESDILFADHQVTPVTAANVGVTLDMTGKLAIAQHTLPLAYGKILRIGLDEVIIPAVEPTATNLNTLLVSLIDCQAVGSAIYDALVSQVGFGGSTGLWATACTAGLGVGATAVNNKIDSIDSSALEFGLVGVAKAIDANKDSKVDTIQTGKWTGTLSYSGSPAPLAEATFNASRM